MPATVRCPACDARFRPPESASDDSLTCPECGERFRPADVAEREAVTAEPGSARPAGTRSRRRRDDRDDEPLPVRRKSSSTGTVLLIVGGTLAVLFLVCAGLATVAGVLMFRAEARRAEARRAVAMNRMAVAVKRADVQRPPIMRAPPPLLDAAAVNAPAVALQGPDNGVVTIQDAIPPNAPRFTGKPFKPFEVSLEQGKTYQVDLQSNRFDPYLRLYGPNNEPLAQNDDGGVGVNARIIFTPRVTGMHKIHATCFSGLRQHPASFTLTLRKQ